MNFTLARRSTRIPLHLCQLRLIPQNIPQHRVEARARGCLLHLTFTVKTAKGGATLLQIVPTQWTSSKPSSSSLFPSPFIICSNPLSSSSASAHPSFVGIGCTLEHYNLMTSFSTELRGLLFACTTFNLVLSLIIL